MSDIEQRYADYHSPDLLTHLRSRTVECYGCYRVEEAADEIERLQANVDMWRRLYRQEMEARLTAILESKP